MRARPHLRQRVLTFFTAGLFTVAASISGCGEDRDFKDNAVVSGSAGTAGNSGRGGASGSAGRSGSSNAGSATSNAGEGGAAGANEAGQGGAPAECAAGEVRDEESGRCREPLGCEEAECPGACEEGDPGEDARCFECDSNQGVNPESERCYRCDEPRDCDATGETGRVLAITTTSGGACLCETKRGYFPDLAGDSTRRCDADGDGWVSDRAQPAVESDEAVVRDNARCSVRYIERFVLVNEAGDEYPVPLEADDLVREFAGNADRDIPEGLPLYESAQNDGASGVLPLYGTEELGRRLEPEELNSLTRACMSEEMDANDNGVPDVGESSESALVPAANAALSAYYAKYATYSYFLELFDGRFATSDATYRISERQRADLSMPVRYLEGADEYVLSCPRHPDALYTWSDGALTAPSTVGADFIRFGVESGIGHPSQFKCVHVVTLEEYGAATERTRPELVTVETVGAAYRLNRQGSTPASYAWVTNSCQAEGTDDQDANPSYAEIRCTPDLARPPAGSVRFAVVGYEPYANSEPYTSIDEPGGYQRGCANACAEVIAEVDCYACNAGGSGEGVVTELAAGAACGTERVCDGHGHCGDCVPGARRCVDGGPELCSEAGAWGNEPACQPGATCLDGVCRTSADGQPCNQSNECSSAVCTTFYTDVDNDTFGGSAASFCGTSPPPGYVTNASDCCDSDADAKPGQLNYFHAARKGCGGYDFDCASGEEPLYPSVGYYECYLYGCYCTDGWYTSVPACGATAGWIVSGSCGYEPRTQGCR